MTVVASDSTADQFDARLLFLPLPRTGRGAGGEGRDFGQDPNPFGLTELVGELQVRALLRVSTLGHTQVLLQLDRQAAVDYQRVTGNERRLR